MDKIVVTRAILGICHMQVCAESEATDEEILGVANSENPSGTTHGWCEVKRTLKDDESEKMLPVKCKDDPKRTHYLLVC